MPENFLRSGRADTVAAFDFDKTLTTRDCVVPFLKSFMTTRRLFGTLADGPALSAAAVRRDRDRVKELVTRRVFGGLHVSEIESSAAALARTIRDRWLRSDVLEKLESHKKAGHRTGIVSASYAQYVRLVGQDLGVDFVIASELEFGDDLKATGHLIEGNCRGPEKARRLRLWMEAHGLEGSVVHAYGDSSGDREMLNMADHPHLVGRR